jgi:hypothetical protein
VKAKKDGEMNKKWKRWLKQSGGDDEDDEDDDDEDDDDEMGRWPGDGTVSLLHEEEEVISSILALGWDDLEQEEEDDVP